MKYSLHWSSKSTVRR